MAENKRITENLNLHKSKFNAYFTKHTKNTTAITRDGMDKIKAFIISNNEVKLDARLKKRYFTSKFILLDVPGTENNMYIKKDKVVI